MVHRVPQRLGIEGTLINSSREKELKDPYKETGVTAKGNFCGAEM